MTPGTEDRVSQYRKKPVVIQAMQWTGDKPSALIEWAQGLGGLTVGWVVDGATKTVIIPTLEGYMTADPGDWIIRGVKGEFYPCKPDIFEATYDPA